MIVGEEVVLDTRSYTILCNVVLLWLSVLVGAALMPVPKTVEER